ncbi:transposon Ty3-G Gag-Pol polyprotein [Elysia marginata]|uniref:Transposon Ty3-G Gag-Pol polyprotein n=1 Tax=Elysia marginata TaxID=1093978 RepID=A0AAV4FA33_9GAST|nr:transposon Ty3-G Gag-Pol polyprotein [Elysia marginata]
MASDRGSQFTSALWTEMTNQLGIQLHRTSAHHPQSNGLVEQFHRTLKAALKTRLKGPNWADELPWVLLGLRTVPMEDLQEYMFRVSVWRTIDIARPVCGPQPNCILNQI